MPKILGSSLTKHRERTRTALFQALSELMSQRSFDKITLSDVANYAGVGRTAVYDHFVNKKDPLLAFMEHEVDRYTKELSRAPAGTQDLIGCLRTYVRQQTLIARHFHSPTPGPLSGAVPRGTAGHLKVHGMLVVQVPSSILTDTMDQGLIPVQEPEWIIPLIHATVMGGRPAPSGSEQRRAYLESLDVLILRTVGARQPIHMAPTIAQSRAIEPLEGTQAPGPPHHNAAG